MSSSPARNRISLPRSRNKITKEHDRLMATEEFIDIFNDSIKKSFPQLHDVFFSYSRLEGVAQDKYGDYVCFNIPTICESLRSSDDPYLFDHMPAAEVIAQKLLEAVEQHPKSKKITQLGLHDGGFLTFRLSPEWMIERIKKMINEGMDTWAPVIYRESVVVHGPAPDIGAHQHAEEVRSRYIKEMLICMFDYSGVDIGTSLTNKESRDAVGEYFAEKEGEITSIRHTTPLFSVKGGHNANNFCEDLQTLWSAINTLRGRLVVYITPVRRREYVIKCFDAATDEEWLSVEWNPIVHCCGYRTTSDEREKLDYVWKIYETHSKVASLVELGNAAGYTREASMECAIKYTYLKTHRLAECTFDIDEMLNEEGNTFVCLLKTLVLISSLSENSGGGGMVKYTEVFYNKERELALHLVHFTEVLQRACLRLLIHPVCEYTWILCKKFMSYYNEVMEFLDWGTYKSKFFLCDATKLVLGKCFHLLKITPESSRVSSRVSNVRTGFEIILRSPSFDPRPNNVNPRFEMFCMNINVADSSFKEGALHGVISLVDADGLLFDERLPLNTNEHGHVSYFYREWNDPIGIRNNAFVMFGSPSPCHLVPFSSTPLDIYVRLYVTTAGMCFEMCNFLEDIKLSEIWEKQLDHKLGTLAFEVDDGSILIDYIALRDAVDVTMELSLESPNDPLFKACVSGCILAYYEGMLDHLDVLSKDCYKAIIYKAAEFEAVTDGSNPQSVSAEFGSELEVGPLSLRKSIMAVPVNGTLVFEARFYDNFGKLIVKSKMRFRAQTKGSNKWRIPLIKNDCFLKLTLEWSQGRVAHK